ncbi:MULTISPECIES: hypothetical protein [Streptomyces]|uniref:hypothetical protein n=1 Tax=Streptomyces nigra TaxID=1827580 RepID=UPI003697A785
MIDRTDRDLTRPAALQMPRQVPPINRTSPHTTGASSSMSGVEANAGPFETIGKGIDKLGKELGKVVGIK